MVIFEITESTNGNLHSVTLPYVSMVDGKTYTVKDQPGLCGDLSIYDKNQYIRLSKLHDAIRRFERFKAINELARYLESKQLTEGDVK